MAEGANAAEALRRRRATTSARSAKRSLKPTINGITASEKAKYKHGHVGMNPAVGESNVYEQRAAPKKKKAAAKPAAPKTKTTATPPKTKPAAPKTKHAKADESIVDTIDQTKAKAAAKEADAAAAASLATPKRRRTPPAPPAKAKRGMTDAQKKKAAKARLKAGGYTNAWFKYRDGAFAAGIFDTKRICFSCHAYATQIRLPRATSAAGCLPSA